MRSTEQIGPTTIHVFQISDVLDKVVCEFQFSDIQIFGMSSHLYCQWARIGHGLENSSRSIGEVVSVFIPRCCFLVFVGFVVLFNSHDVLMQRMWLLASPELDDHRLDVHFAKYDHEYLLCQRLCLAMSSKCITYLYPRKFCTHVYEDVAPEKARLYYHGRWRTFPCELWLLRIHNDRCVYGNQLHCFRFAF